MSMSRYFLPRLSVVFALSFIVTQAVAEETAVIPPIPYPAKTIAKGADRALIQRGEYLAKAGDCIACHTDTTAKNPKPYAGGLPIQTPFGVFYSRNITADKQTGIGNWTNAQFIASMRHGILPDGSYSFPVFPYPSFNHVTPADLLAIKAYLFAIPPVNQANKDPEAPWPFSWRFSQFGWRTLFFRDNGPYQKDPKQTAEWNRGAYLVKGLGHCGECHTPRNKLGGSKNDYALTGGFVDGYYAPNISAVGLTKNSVDEIVNVFSKDQLLNGRGAVGGPMADVNRNSLRYLTTADLRAMAVYLKTVQSKQPEVASGGTSSSEVKSAYKDHCAICHDVGAAGAPKTGDAVAWAPRIQLGLNTLYKNAINGINSMPAMGACPTCSQDQIKAIVRYMVAQSQKDNGKASTTSALKVLTMADGQRIYQANCATCHDPNATHPLAQNAPKIDDKAAWQARLAKNIDTLVLNTRHGFGDMPKNGGCAKCTTADIKAAVKYMAQQSQTSNDYSLW